MLRKGWNSFAKPLGWIVRMTGILFHHLFFTAPYTAQAESWRKASEEDSSRSQSAAPSDTSSKKV